ncbi:MAG: rhodanese-like domain-containing protein, partial [Gammaproteobacteria bacterium]|nr:rhodanese-like domain-containing protein [Gammaproteobacteria bacterium]
MTTAITQHPAANSDAALQHFENMLSFETDCWDTNESLQSPEPDFILVDVRSPELFAKGHIKSAINIPHRKIV